MPEKQEKIIDTLINERAGGLLRLPFAKAIANISLYPWLNYKETARIFDGMAEAPSGLAALQVISDAVPLTLDVRGQEHIPAKKCAIVVSNHPTGICDGNAVFQTIRPIREDLIFMANRDAVRIAQRFAEVIIPVEWIEANRTRQRSRETAKAAIQAIHQNRLIIIFPSGRIAARHSDGNLKEREWSNTAVRFAQKYNLPIVPMYLDGRNSAFYYFLSKVSAQLRDLSIFHEVLNKKGSLFKIRFAPLIQPQNLIGNVDEITASLQKYVSSGFQEDTNWGEAKDG